MGGVGVCDDLRPDSESDDEYARWCRGFGPTGNGGGSNKGMMGDNGCRTEEVVSDIVRRTLGVSLPEKMGVFMMSNCGRLLTL